MKHFSSDGCVEIDYDKSMFSHSDDETIDYEINVVSDFKINISLLIYLDNIFFI